MLKKAYRLRKNKEFRAVYRLKNSVAAGTVVLYIRDNRGAEVPKVGFSVSKKIGKAVVRNRCRRILREAVRAHLKEIAPGRDYVFVGRKALAGADYFRAEKDLLALLKRKRCLL